MKFSLKDYRIGRPALSGALASVAFQFSFVAPVGPAYLDRVVFLLPGILFGAFVLLPEAGGRPSKALRQTVLLVLSTAIWYLSFIVFFYGAMVSNLSNMLLSMVSGWAGGLLILLLCRLVLPAQFNAGAILLSFTFGGLGGLLIGASTLVPDNRWVGHGLSLMGFILWHAGMAAAVTDMIGNKPVLFADGK